MFDQREALINTETVAMLPSPVTRDAFVAAVTTHDAASYGITHAAAAQRELVERLVNEHGDALTARQVRLAVERWIEEWRSGPKPEQTEGQKLLADIEKAEKRCGRRGRGSTW